MRFDLFFHALKKRGKSSIRNGTFLLWQLLLPSFLLDGIYIKKAGKALLKVGHGGKSHSGDILKCA